MPCLSEPEFLRTMTTPMRPLEAAAEPPFDFWPYFDSIAPEDFEGHNCSEGRVSRVWADATGRFQHVLVASEREDIFMVIVLDVPARAIVGHRLLDLPREYGLDDRSGAGVAGPFWFVQVKYLLAVPLPVADTEEIAVGYFRSYVVRAADEQEARHMAAGRPQEEAVRSTEIAEVTPIELSEAQAYNPAISALAKRGVLHSTGRSFFGTG